MTPLEFAEWLTGMLARAGELTNIVTSNDDAAELEVTDPTGRVHLVTVT